MKSVLFIYLDQSNGYGNSAKSLLRVLNRLDDVEIDLVPINRPNIQHEKELKQRYDVGIVHVSAASLIQDFQARGYMAMSLSRCEKRFHYFLWEADRVPSYCNNFYRSDAITGLICPSQFCVDLVSGFGKEIHKIPITSEQFDYIPDRRRSTKDRFTVLTVAQLSARKAIDMSVCAFATAFVGQKDVEYYIKLGEKLDGTDADSLIRGNVGRSMIPQGQCPEIYLIEQQYQEEQMRDLYLSSDCYLHLSRGEGFGMTPLTAISNGLPVIYSDWSAHTEFLKESPGSLPVNGRLDLVHSMDPRFGFEIGMMWFEPNVASAVTALKVAYDNWMTRKIKYTVPDVVQQYTDESAVPAAAAMLGMSEYNIKTENKIDGISIIEV